MASSPGYRTQCRDLQAYGKVKEGEDGPRLDWGKHPPERDGSQAGGNHPCQVEPSRSW